jgi:hypothetical protein
MKAPMHDHQINIRLAAPHDADTLARLAALDSAPALSGRVLLAALDGEPAAAVSLETGAVTADPFRPTQDAVRVLRLRRYQILRQGRDVAPARFLLRRLAPGAA